MISTLMLWLLAPLSIYLGLQAAGSAVLTFLLFYGGVCLMVPVIDLILLRKNAWPEAMKLLGFSHFRKSIVPATLLGAVFGVSIVAFFMLLEKSVLDLAQMQTILDQWHIDKRYVVPLLITMVVANSLFEEVYWRGYMVHRLKGMTGRWGIILLTSAFYASYHLITTVSLFSWLYGMIFTAVVYGIGVFWGYVRMRFDSIYLPVISHLLADLGIMVIYVKYFV